MEQENDHRQAFLDEISGIVDREDIDEEETVELVRVKLAAYLAKHPEEGLKVSEMLESDFMCRRIEQLLGEIE